MMASPMAFGDSRSYYRAVQGQQNQVAPYWPNAYQNVASQHNQLSHQLMALTRSYVSQLAIEAKPAKELASPDRVITDMGFGGAEAKPRSRRYRRAKTK